MCQDTNTWAFWAQANTGRRQLLPVAVDYTSSLTISQSTRPSPQGLRLLLAAEGRQAHLPLCCAITHHLRPRRTSVRHAVHLRVGISNLL